MRRCPASIFNQKGVTFVAAAGDTGEPALAPATYNDVVAVGASVLTLNNDGTNDNFDGSDFATWSNEVGWGNPASGQNQSQNGGGSGGGYSVGIPTPSYQNGLVIHDGNQIISSDGYRVTPDLSFLGGSSASADFAVVTIVGGKGGSRWRHQPLGSLHCRPGRDCRSGDRGQRWNARFPARRHWPGFIASPPMTITTS